MGCWAPARRERTMLQLARWEDPLPSGSGRNRIEQLEVIMVDSMGECPSLPAISYASRWTTTLCFNFIAADNNFRKVAVTENYCHVVHAFPSVIKEISTRLNK
uniref:BPM/SPOP BACK domain-containing protein n=1 Tax=Leersia perrieri TaxID=77586 RepID=A0A0D9X9X7_9ORYZ